MLLVTLTCIYRQGAGTNKLPSAFNLYGLFLAYGYDSLSNPYEYQYYLKQTPKLKKTPIKHIILVIDESIRADYSPFQRVKIPKQWRIYDYGRAFSYANTSAVSNVLLRKGVRYESFIKDFYENPLIWEYAKYAGYKTYLMDNQMGGIGHNYFNQTELLMIDDNISKTDLSDQQLPQELRYLNQPKKTFTIIIKKGAHFPYDAYPREWGKEMQYDSYTSQNKMRKEYFKTLTYQSDCFWQEFFKMKFKEPILIIYTSDHGQNLQDVEGLTHGSTKDPYMGEGVVPLVVLSNVDFTLEENFLKNKGMASHFNVVPTILDAMGFNAWNLGYQGKSASLFERVQSVGGFFYGVPFGYFGKEPDFKKVQIGS